MLRIMKKKEKNRKLVWEYLKIWMGIFQVAVSGWEFSKGEFTRGEFDWWKFSGLEFSGWEFSWYGKKYTKNSQVYMHWHWSSSEKSSISKPIASEFSPPPIITFFYGAEIFLHPLVQLTGHISTLRYTEI